MNPTSPNDYKTIKGIEVSEFEVEKSVFITTAKHVESEGEALTFIDEIRENIRMRPIIAPPI